MYPVSSHNAHSYFGIKYEESIFKEFKIKFFSFFNLDISRLYFPLSSLELEERFNFAREIEYLERD